MNTQKAKSVRRKSRSTRVHGAESSCNCWHEKDTKLREMGYKISDACTLLQIKDLNLTVKFGLPLQRTDEAKLKRSDPCLLTISYCPFCGKKL